MVVVFDARTGAPAAFLMDNGYITDLRTAAAGAVAAKHLAKGSIERVAVIGSGAQARLQPALLARVRSYRDVRVWGRNPVRAGACAEDLGRRGDLPAGAAVHVAPSARAAVEGVDLVITATASREPIVRAEWLAPGALVIAVGSDGADKQELEVEVMKRADRIVADSLPQCLRLGEIHHAVERGAIRKEKVDAELGEITSGRKPGRRADSEIIVCDLTGVGVQDVAAASVVLERARSRGAGERLVI
jgi:ornithine cyclodeaminase